jgi:uncharacterized membrane protein YdcZ (DUF606 family)
MIIGIGLLLRFAWPLNNRLMSVNNNPLITFGIYFPLGLLTYAGVLFALPRVSVALVLCAGFVGLTLGSLILEKFGLLGTPKFPIRPIRVLGLLLLLCALFLL